MLSQAACVADKIRVVLIAIDIYFSGGCNGIVCFVSFSAYDPNLYSRMVIDYNAVIPILYIQPYLFSNGRIERFIIKNLFYVTIFIHFMDHYQQTIMGGIGYFYQFVFIAGLDIYIFI